MAQTPSALPYPISPPTTNTPPLPPKQHQGLPRLPDQPPPPPPPPPNGQKYELPGQSYDLRQQRPRPPQFEEGWLPEVLLDKNKNDLHILLSSQILLSGLLSAPQTAHPSLPASIEPLKHALDSNTAITNSILATANTVTSLRESLTTQLLQLHALERQWRQKQVAMDDALAPFSPKALHQRLVASIGEQESYMKALEESFLEEEGRAGEREVGDLIKRYKEGVKVLTLRREGRARWEEGRVGGWR